MRKCLWDSNINKGRHFAKYDLETSRKSFSKYVSLFVLCAFKHTNIGVLNRTAYTQEIGNKAHYFYL